MTMHIAPLTFYYSVEQAADIIELLDALRDVMWDTYGEQIQQMHRAHCAHERNESQCDFDFDDDIPF